MDGNEYEVVESKIEQLKSYMRFRDLGVAYVFGLFLSVQLMLTAYVKFVVNNVFILNIFLFVLSLIGVVLFVIFTFFGLKNRNEFKWYHAVYYIAYLFLFACIIYLDFLKQSNNITRSLGTFWAYIILMLGLLIFLLSGYFKSETIKTIRNSKRNERVDLIKYYILAAFSKGDINFEEYSANNISKLNEAMVNEIRSDVKLAECFSNSFESFKSGFNLKSVEYKNKSNISYAAATISAIVSFCITGFNKIYDSWNTYLTAVWKADEKATIIEGICNQETIKHYSEMLDLTIAYQGLILATIILIFVCIYVFRNILNTTNSTRLENFRLSQIALSKIKQDVTLPKKENTSIPQSEMNSSAN